MTILQNCDLLERIGKNQGQRGGVGGHLHVVLLAAGHHLHLEPDGQVEHHQKEAQEHTQRPQGTLEENLNISY